MSDHAAKTEEFYERVITDTIEKLASEFENAGVSLQALLRLQEVWKASMVASVRAPILDPQMSAAVMPGASVGGVRGQGVSEGGRREGGGREGDAAKMGVYGSYGSSHAGFGSSNGSLATNVVVKEDPLRYTKVDGSFGVSPSPSPANGSFGASPANGSFGAAPSPANGTSSTPVKRDVLEDGTDQTSVVGFNPSDHSHPTHPTHQTDHPNHQSEHTNQNQTNPSNQNQTNPSNPTAHSIQPNDPSHPSTHQSSPPPPIDAKKQDDLDDELSSLSSDVSDEEEMDTSSWTNSLMAFYEEPTKRTKNKRTYKLAKGILNIDGRDYPFKSGKAEFDWK